MNILKRPIRYLLNVVAQRVEKNHLFEQPQERVKQSPIQLQKPKKEEKVVFSSIEDIANDLGQSRGFLLVHHWATWCDGCMEELDDIHQFVLSLDTDSIPTYGISWELFNGTPPQHAIPVVEHVYQAHGLTFPTHIVKGAPEELFSRLSLKEQQIPQTALYKDGMLLYSHLGILSEAERQIIRNHIRDTL